MKLKPPLITAMLLFGGRVCMAQASIAPDVYASAGSCYVNSIASLCWTIGEPLSETDLASVGYLTQGFHQPVKIIITNVMTSESPQGNVSAYPNPFTSTINLQNHESNKPLQVELINVEGKTIFTRTMTSQQEQFDMSEFANGIYFLKIYDTNKQLLQTLKIDKTK